ncbi:isopenicillin N synthase family oxygenase [Rhodospirillaceae bacterium KN72]|uniref:2-oxoglutarate-dependent ethylene/succinate-forming enzyme n=1 Tax=Pacificispira spongiicola TaxID=2729598 RepID=A0A7Y0HD02_9PROT|nr:isopenicillin N synthase family oxygenase [Pacificispira spongiicola]NMM43266.1 isopenicillin N synthase family oxygenase [Pacificispira spongiicola]
MTDFNLLTIDCQASDAPQRLVQSLRDTGFAVLTNHPISAGEIADVYAGWEAFFASDAKFDYLTTPETQTGYFPFKSENAKGYSKKDLKEFFHVYPHGPVPADLEAMTRDFYDKLVALGRAMLSWIEDNSPEDIRALFSEPLPQMLDGSSMNLLRILHYPPQDPEDAHSGAVRAAAHEDINLITLLVSGSAPGLEARDAKGNWHEVPCDTGMITMNIGDMLQKASGGYYPSTTHRVVNPKEGQNVSRYSMPMFLHPRPDVRLDADYTANDYLQERLREIGLKG